MPIRNIRKTVCHPSPNVVKCYLGAISIYSSAADLVSAPELFLIPLNRKPLHINSATVDCSMWSSRSPRRTSLHTPHSRDQSEVIPTLRPSLTTSSSSSTAAGPSGQSTAPGQTSKRRRVPESITRNACLNCKKARAKVGFLKQTSFVLC